MKNLEKSDTYARELLKGVTTGFSPHPTSKSYHGFTCPNCGRHEFGTSTWRRLDGTKTTVGHCHGNDHSGNGCSFKWNRDIEVDEANAIHSMTSEEWAAQYEKK